MKIALVYSFDESHWFSCSVITKNIISAYKGAFGAENLIHINYGEKGFDLPELKKATGVCERFVFVDHKPSPLEFLLQFQKYFSKQFNQCEFIFHIFGDFILYINDWRVITNLLKKNHMKFVCASNAQQEMIRKFFNVKESIYMTPFPVSESEFCLQEGSKKSNKTIYLYTGRISYQKRIIELVKYFHDAVTSGVISENSELHLVGKYDNIGHPYINIHFREGEFFRKLDKVLSKLPNYEKYIKFLGSLSHEEICHQYQQADFFISLSTYHDEDYGMSVAEALCSGVPCILTSWGGYKSFFLEQTHSTEFIPVTLDYPLPCIDQSKFNEALKNTKNKNFEKKLISKYALGKYGVKKVADDLKLILKDKPVAFGGLTSEMIFLSSRAASNYSLFYNNIDRNYSKLYYELYDAYVR